MANWNPWHGCKKYSEGCVNCYVYTMDTIYKRDSSDIKKNADFNLLVRKNRKGEYKIPSGETVYTCFTSDFLLDAADDWRTECWEFIRKRSDLNFVFLTKRIERLSAVLPSDWGDGYDNVGIGCTVENQARADFRLPIFLKLPIKKRFIAVSPILEEIDLSKYLSKKIDKVAVGGESGINARICNYDWVLKIREQCLQNDIKFWFQQTGYRFVKNNKLYIIDRKMQHLQARKANINILNGELML